jgi:hypothetical protein
MRKEIEDAQALYPSVLRGFCGGCGGIYPQPQHRHGQRGHPCQEGHGRLRKPLHQPVQRSARLGPTVNYCPWIDGGDTKFSQPLVMTLDTGTRNPTNQIKL